MKLSKLISVLQDELKNNGDAEHVALGLALQGDTPSRIDAYGAINLVSDHANYPNGIVYLVADYEVLPPPKHTTPLKRRQEKQADEPARQRISHPKPGVTAHRCV